MNKKYEKYILATLALAMGVIQPGDARFDLKEINKNRSLIAHGDQPGSCAGHTKAIAEEQAKYEAQQKKKKKKKQAAQTANPDGAYSYRIDKDTDSGESEESEE